MSIPPELMPSDMLRTRLLCPRCYADLAFCIGVIVGILIGGWLT